MHGEYEGVFVRKDCPFNLSLDTPPHEPLGRGIHACMAGTWMRARFFDPPTFKIYPKPTLCYPTYTPEF